MPTFDFEGRTKEGKLINGQRSAQTADSLATQLMSNGIIPIHITEIKEKLSDDAWAAIKTRLQRKRLSQDDLGMFARQMHTLCKTGVPIVHAIRQLSLSTHSLQMQKALQDISEQLESGKDLASSMLLHPEVFTPLMVSMIKIGQNSGRLDEAFLRLNQYIELESSALKKVKSALRYPTFVLIAVVAALVIINLFVVPTFAKIFTQANIALPLVTVYLITLSNFLINYWYLIVLGLIITIYYFRRYIQTPSGKLRWDKFQLHIPFVGPVLKKILLLRFAQLFSIIINSGIPLVDGLALVSNAMNNEYAAQEILKMREAITHGKNITKAATSTELFTPLELQMLTISEETGEIGYLFDQVADFYRQEVDYDLKKLGDLIEPIVTIGLGFIILFLAFAVYLPMWNMVKMVK